MKVDALSRRSDFELHPRDDAYAQQSQCLLKVEQFQLFATCLLHDDSLLDEIAKALHTDKFANDINLEGLTKPSKTNNKEDRDCFRFEGGVSLICSGGPFSNSSSPKVSRRPTG